jgi:Holliday junction resolvase
MEAEEFVKRLNNKGKNNETKLQRSIQKYLNNIGAYEFKVHGSIYMKAGIPDIICCYNGLFIGIECKVGNNKMSQLQEAHKNQIIKAKGIHILAYSLNDVKNVIKNL